ncbi:unnamed protein product [Trichogramma brassicae]|uniref:Uncharacterized protein n=1 Tax=Trichogramma brassicae TaxID=86971 RepID=A0A6H5IP03_9HYME|nr:unnamed protein product [Trichogramma brassicae]
MLAPRSLEESASPQARAPEISDLGRPTSTPFHDGGEDLPWSSRHHMRRCDDGHEARRHILRGPRSRERPTRRTRRQRNGPHREYGRSTCSSGASRACSRPRRPRSRRRWPGGRCACTPAHRP